MGGQRFQGQQISGRTESGNLAHGDRRDEGVVAKLLSLMNIRQVDFHRGQRDGGDRITNCNAGMGIRSRIDDDAFEMPSGVLNQVTSSPSVLLCLVCTAIPNSSARRAMDVLMSSNDICP